MKYLKHFTVIVMLTAGTVWAAAVWQGTGSIQDGQVITAGTIRDNFDYLYSRAWNYLDGTDDSYMQTNRSVAAPEYCDESGEHCVSIDDVEIVVNNYEDSKYASCNSGYYQVNNFTYSGSPSGGTGLRLVSNPGGVCTDQVPDALHGQMYYMQVTHGTNNFIQCIDGTWVRISGICAPG